MCSNSWIITGKAKSGVALNLTRTFHKWLLHQHFRLFSFYVRSEHNVSADFLSRSSEVEIAEWANEHQMTRIFPLRQWLDFCKNFKMTIPIVLDAEIPLQVKTSSNLRTVEWQPGGYCLTQAASKLQICCEWLDPRHSRIARLVSKCGYMEYTSGKVHFMGGSIKDGGEATEFLVAFATCKAEQGLMVTSDFVDLTQLGVSGFSQHASVDSSQHGDVLANRWNLYAVGSFDLQRLAQSLPRHPPCSLGERYRACGFDISADGPGVRQVYDIPGCLGKEVRIHSDDGEWYFSAESSYAGMPHGCSLHTSWRWPLVASTGTVPTIGERLAVLGGLDQFRTLPLADDGFSNDALWRLTPNVIWRSALAVASNSPEQGVECNDAMNISTSRYHTGVHHTSRVEWTCRRHRLTWNSRSQRPDVRDLDRIAWANVRQPRRLSLELGPHGYIGIPKVRAIDHYPGSCALSDTHSLDDEEYTASSTWVTDSNNRYSTRDLETYTIDNKWISTQPRFSYKKLWYAEQSFLTGLYGFHFEAYFYEALRRSVYGHFDFSHLEAPEWFATSTSSLMCQKPGCRGMVSLLRIRMRNGFVTFDDLTSTLVQCTDTHVVEFAQWVLKGRLSGIKIRMVSRPESR